MKPISAMSNGLLERELSKQLPKFVLAYDLKYENNAYNPTDFISFEIERFEFYFEFVKHGPKAFWVAPNATDPKNQITPEQMVQNLLEAMEEAEHDPNDPATLIITQDDVEIQSYYGMYVDSLAEALIEVENWVKRPVSEWPKNYNKPVEPLDDLKFEIKRL